MANIVLVKESHLPQLTALVDYHLGALVPGWTVTPDYMASRLRRDPDEVITDAWIEERRTLVAIDEDRVVAAAHLHKYGDDTPNKGVGDIAWSLFWPGEENAASSLLAVAQTAMADWHVETEWIFGGGLPVPMCNGVPDTWPHITYFIQNAGYGDTISEEALYYGPAEPASAPLAPPIEGIVIQQDDGEFGARFRVFSGDKAIGGCECVVDMTRGGQLPALRGWIELSEVEVHESYRDRGVGSWMLRLVQEAIQAAELPTHVILRTAGPISIDGVLDEPSWRAAATVGDFVFPWWTEGEKEQTEARLLWDDTNLYVSFVAHDKHISAVYESRDDPVSKDDCVEVFVAPDTSNIGHYYNIEVNVLGTILDRFQLAEPTGSYTAPVSVATRIDGSLNDESDLDRSFVTEFAIPFSSFTETAPHIPPEPEDVWRLNLYRIGGKVNFQYSMWSDTWNEKPKYHAPKRFGVIHFSADTVNVNGDETQ